MTSTVVPADDDLVELQPCPFCGSADVNLCEFESDGPFYADCRGCGMHTPNTDTKAELLAAWNTRASLSSELARCRNALEALFIASKFHDPDTWNGEPAMIEAAQVLGEPPFGAQS